jgi:hypothetical protein
MISSLKSLTTSFVRLFLVLVLVGLTPVQIQAAELKVELKLIWGTNGKTSPNPKHKPVDEVTAAKLRKVFTWTNYYEINRVTGTVPSRSTNSFHMSKDCTIQIKELEGPNVEVKLIGEGKPVIKATHHLSKSQTITLASECRDKDGNAWFVLITELDEK